jgi:DNA-binding LacI/PurR family transcriptional regulator
MRIDLHSFDRSARTPLHQQLTTLLAKAIEDGVYRPGERIEPERQFMQHGELSYPTVSRALRELANRGLVTRKVGSGTFVTERTADSPATTIKSLGVFYYRLGTPYFDGLMQGVEEAAREFDIDVLPVSTGADPQEEPRIISELVDQQIDALIAIPLGAQMTQRALRAVVEKRQLPVVTVGMVYPQMPCDAVTFNNEHGGWELARHLLELGHERIALVANSLMYPNTTNLDLWQGVVQAHRERDMTFDDNAHIQLPMLFDEQHDRAVADSILSLWDQPADDAPTAVICATDHIARYTTNLLRDAGAEVPGQVSVCGYGDWAVASRFDPALTTVAIPLRRGGREAVRSLVDRKRDPDRNPRERMLDMSVVIRRSTVLPPKRAFTLK